MTRRRKAAAGKLPHNSLKNIYCSLHFHNVCSCLCPAEEEDGGEEGVEMDEVRVTNKHSTSEGEEEVEDPGV